MNEPRAQSPGSPAFIDRAIRDTPTARTRNPSLSFRARSNTARSPHTPYTFFTFALRCRSSGSCDSGLPVTFLHSSSAPYRRPWA
jgi:hypothetical protein